jgi:tryptophan synthase alpha chain
MSRIAETFVRLREQGRKALIPFITAGDPEPGITVPTMHAMVEAGASIIELGVPFSDPMADGPVIQHASERALKHHVGLRDVLAMVKQFRHQDNQTPVVLMGYLNPIEVMGYESFAVAAAEAGVDGILTVDMPPEEGNALNSALRSQGIDTIFLLAPTTGEARIQRICEQASGFVYYVSVKGITGSASLDTEEVAKRLDLIRSKTSLPVGVGFGIKDGASAARVAKMADAVIVGSALVSRFEALQLESDKIPAQAAAFISELRTAMDD